MLCKHLLCALFLLSFAATGKGQSDQQINVSGNLGYVGEGQRVLEVTYRKIAGGYQFDSCKVVNGNFRFEKNIHEPVIAILSLKQAPGTQPNTRGVYDYVSLFLLPGDVTIQAPDNLRNATVSGKGAVANNDYQQYLAKSNLYIDTLNSVGPFLNGLSLSAAEKERRGTEMRDSISRIRDQKVYLNFVLSKPKSPLTSLALLDYAGEPVWTPRKKMVPEEIEKLLNKLPREYQSYPSLVALKQELQVSKTTGIGKPIIDFTLEDTSGKKIKLSDFKGQYVFLDFWASWCVPCRKENPNVKSQFLKYKDKGFTVVSVSLDKPDARQAWIEAIRKDQIGLWTHLGDLNGFNGEVAKEYYVRSIPTNFLISPDGKFLGRNLYGQALDKALDKIFGSARGVANQGDTMVRYYSRLANSSNESDKAKLQVQLYQLLKSNKEQDWLTARRFFYQIKKVNVSDSIAREVKLKFPLGITVRDDKADTVYKEKDPVKKEKLYQAWVKKFPPEKFDADNQISYDYARLFIAQAYAEADNVEKALQYANMIATPVWKGEGWAGTAQVLKRKGHLKEAAELYEKARANSYKFMTTNRNDPGAGFAAMGYRMYSAPLAEIYVEQKRYAEALPIVKAAYDSSKTVNGSVNASYAKVLMAMGKDQEAFNLIDEAVKAGQANQSMKDDLKILYAKVKGSDAGYDEYMTFVNKQLAEKIRKDLAKDIINLPAANFTLKDVDGNTVSLADLKGKTVVLDFWATWCGPCKASFPAMKMAVERFKGDPNVKFLFIHTWERDENATASAKKYVTDNNYPFEVLMDLKNSEGINPVVDSYKVSGIPTKFVIDGNGNIRFRFTGFSGGEDAAVEEVAGMIDLARNAK